MCIKVLYNHHTDTIRWCQIPGHTSQLLMLLHEAEAFGGQLYSKAIKIRVTAN